MEETRLVFLKGLNFVYFSRKKDGGRDETLKKSPQITKT